jgi:hypothetical protein
MGVAQAAKLVSRHRRDLASVSGLSVEFRES